MSATDALCRSWLDLRWHLDPVAASLAGERAHDTRWGLADAAATREALAALRSLAGACEDLDVESAEEEIDRTALLDELRVAAQRLEHERPHERNPHWWLQHLFDGLWVLGARGETAAEWTPAFLARLDGLPAQLDAARATLKQPPLVHVDQALAALGGGGALVAEMAGRAAAASAERAEEITATATRALEALRAFGNALNHEIEPDHDPHAFALGELAFVQRLHHEHALRGGPGELHRWAMRQREELQAHLAAEARALTGTDDWRALVVRIVEAAPAPGDLAAAGTAELARLQAVLAATGLVAAEDGPTAALTPPHLRSVHPVSLYRSIDGRGVVFLSPDADGALGEHAADALPALLARDGVPGRHLFGQRARQAPTLVRRTLRAPTMHGGWGLLATDLLDELGGYGTPERRLFRLVLQLQAALRVEIDVGLHARQLTRGAAIDLLTAHLPISRRTADAEVRRCCAAPTHHLCDAVGRRDLRTLRHDLDRAAGGALALGAFADRVLQFGGLPIPLVRWGLGVDG